MRSPPSQLKRVEITALFNAVGHDVDLQLGGPDRVTVLYGRNGAGKTVTLRLIEAVAAGRMEVLASFPFQRLRLTLEDGSTLTVEPRDERLSFATVVDGQTSKATWPSQEAPRLIRPRGSHALSLPETLELLRDADRLAYPVVEELTELTKTPPELGAFLARLPSVRSLDINRTLHQEDRLAVHRISQDVRAAVIEADQQYRLISTELDSTLAQRLFQAHLGALDKRDLEARHHAVEDREQELRALGLLQVKRAPLNPQAIGDANLQAFAVILEDREAKLKPFEALRQRAHRLLESLNLKLAPKQIRLDVERGYEVVSPTGAPLRLDQLSSGEQHQLVLMHALLFDLAPGSLLLIDEPELSLHVAWQQQVILDLIEIAKLTDSKVILATHSPYIVGDRHDLMVRIGGDPPRGEPPPPDSAEAAPTAL